MTSTANYTYTIVKDGDSTNVTVFVPGETPYVADNTHINFDAIVKAIIANEEADFESLFDISVGIGKRFLYLTDRVSVRNGRIYFDLEEVDNSLTQQILRFLEEGVESWEPLVRFFENVADNPQEHSRKQLYSWLDKHKFTITDEGYIVGYKGVSTSIKPNPETLKFLEEEYDDQLDIGYSTQSGNAIVDGQEINGYIPYPIGAVVEMPRSEVTHDPSQGCSYGLHVGTFAFARSYGPKMLEVHVNPRDVVSVPTDSNAQKIRTCRLYVVGEIDQEYETVIKPYDELYEDEFFDDGCKYDDECDCHDPEPVKDNLVKATGKDIEALSSIAKKRKRGFERTALAQGWEKRWEDDAPTSDEYDWYRPVEWRLPLTSK